MSDFLNSIQWSSDKFSLKKVVELFPLPQVVKIQKGLSADPGRNTDTNEILVIHTVRTIETVRATDSLKNEFFIPCNTTARVEVIWKGYKKFYDNVEELSEDFPAHVLVVEDDRSLGLQKGDVLKLRQNIKSAYLKCAVVNRAHEDINIPFGSKGLFKTLGDLKQEHVLLRDVIQHCTLPLAVKFINNKLKMKRADGSSRFPIALCNLDKVMLHEVRNNSDIVADKTLSLGDRVCLMSIPLEDQDIEVIVPTAATRSNKSYTTFCSTITQRTNPETLRTVGIQHSHWIVFQEDDNATLPSQLARADSASSSTFSSFQVHQEEDQLGNIRIVAALNSNMDSTSVPSNEPIYSQVIPRHLRKISVPAVSRDPVPPVPPKGFAYSSIASSHEVQVRRFSEPVVPVIPPKEFFYSSVTPVHAKSHQEAQGRRFSEAAVLSKWKKKLTRQSSNSYPRDPTLSDTPVDASPNVYESIWIGKISQDDEQDNVMPIILDRFGGSEHLNAEDGYVTMRSNVLRRESIYEDVEDIKAHFLSQLGETNISVHPNTGTSEEKSFQTPVDRRRQGVNRQQLIPPTNGPAQGFQDKLKSKSKEKLKPYEEAPPFEINADRRNSYDLKSDKKTKAPPKLGFLDKDVRNWSEKDVAKFLKNINLDQYIKTFKEKKVDGKVLESLNEDILSKDMKITNKSHVMRLIKFTGECIKHEKTLIQNVYHTSCSS